MTLELISNVQCFNGEQRRYRHASAVNQCDMTFSVFVPPGATATHTRPMVVWLSGLTCTDENFVQKAGAQRIAAELNILLLCPDTSPRGSDVPDDSDKAWDFGLGAGFYVNATQAPWHKHYRMFDYVNEELPALVAEHVPWNGRASICGHSMGGHGALVSALRLPERYQSASAFAPIAHPSQCPWGRKAFSHYLGDSPDSWQAYDTCELLNRTPSELPIRIDQGEADNFLSEQLHIDHLQSIAPSQAPNMRIHRHAGYDHSYFFIATFIEAHLRFHAGHLTQ